MPTQSSESAKISAGEIDPLVFRPIYQREKIAKMRAYFLRRGAGPISFAPMMRTLIANAELSPSFVGAITFQRTLESHRRLEDNAKKRKGAKPQIKFVGATVAFHPNEVLGKLSKLTDIAISETGDPQIKIGAVCRALISMVALDEEFYDKVLERVSFEAAERSKIRKPRTSFEQHRQIIDVPVVKEHRPLKKRRPIGTRRNRKHGKK